MRNNIPLFLCPVFIILISISTACTTALASPTPPSVPPTPPASPLPGVTHSATPETRLARTPTLRPSSTGTPSPVPTSPDDPIWEFHDSLKDLPVIEPGNAAGLVLLAELDGSLVFSPHPGTFALAREGGISIYSMDALAEIDWLPCETEWPCAFNYSPDGRFLAWNPQGGVVRIRDITTGQDFGELAPTSDQCCTQIKYSPDGRYLATLEWEETTGSVWDLESGREILSLDQIQQIHFSPDGKTLAAESARSLSLTLWDITSQQSIRSLNGFSTAAPRYAVIFSPDWHYVLWIDGRVGAQLMNVTTGRLGPGLQLSEGSFSPDRRTLAGTEHGWGEFECTNQICLFDTLSGNLQSKLKHEGIVWELAFSPDGRLLAGVSQGQVSIWDVAARSTLTVLDPESEEGAWEVSFSPDGRILAIHIRGSRTQLWGVAP